MYATVEEVKKYIGIQDSTSDDELIRQLILTSQNLIDKICHRRFEVEEPTLRYFDARRDVQGRVLFLDEDLCQIESITNGDGAEVLADQYVTEPKDTPPFWAIRLLDSSPISWTFTNSPEKAIQILGWWGYSRTAPEVVKHLCRIASAAFYRQREAQNPIGETIMLMGGAQLSAPKDIIQYLEVQCSNLGLVRWVS